MKMKIDMIIILIENIIINNLWHIAIHVYIGFVLPGYSPNKRLKDLK